MFTIMHTGDLHYDEFSPRWDETLMVQSRVALRVRERRPNLVTIGGDIYERRSTPRERLAVAGWLQAIAEVCPIVITKGNHDLELDLALLSDLQTRHPIHVVEDARVIEVAGAIIACIAWPTRAGAIDDGMAREQLRDVLRGLSVELADGVGSPRLALGHFDLDGARTGAGQPVIGGSVRVSLGDLGLLGAQAVLLSHIHAPQDFLFCETPVIYAGSPVAHDYGESEQKSVVWLEVDGDRVSFTREPTGARPMFLGEADWDPDGPGWTWLDGSPPLTMLSAEDLNGADVRFRYHVRAEHMAVARVAAKELCERLRGMGAARVTPDPVPEASVRARDGAMAVVTARTLEEKMEATWAARNDVPPPQVAARLKSKLHLLEQGVRP